jgi:hypothetical protein
MCVFHTQLFYKISFNPRPEFLVGMNDELPVHVVQDLGPEGGQGVG